MSNVLKTTVLHILSGFLVVSGRRVYLVPVTLFWWEAEGNLTGLKLQISCQVVTAAVFEDWVRYLTYTIYFNLTGLIMSAVSLARRRAYERDNSLENEQREWFPEMESTGEDAMKITKMTRKDLEYFKT